jgi:hypothetical protein
MRRTTGTLLVALLAVAAAGTVVATGEATVGDARAGEATIGDAIVGDSDGKMRADDDLTVRVETPRTVAANVTQNYAVDVSGADGNVTVEWTFDGEAKRGETVTHTWPDGGNATITVTVTDADGDTASRELVVEVVEYGDEDEAENSLDNVATIALFIAILGGGPLVLLVFVVPKAMQVFSDAL